MATGYRDDDQRAYDSQFHNDDPDMPPNDRYDETEIVAYDIIREGGGVIARVGTARLAAAFLRAEPEASHAEPVVAGSLDRIVDDIMETVRIAGESPDRAICARASIAASIAAMLIAERCRGATLALQNETARSPEPSLDVARCGTSSVAEGTLARTADSVDIEPLVDALFEAASRMGTLIGCGGEAEGARLQAKSAKLHLLAAIRAALAATEPTP